MAFCVCVAYMAIFHLIILSIKQHSAVRVSDLQRSEDSAVMDPIQKENKSQ